MKLTNRIIVAIPVKNEERLIGICLDAILKQTRLPDNILLLLNNCTDNTLEICRAAQSNFSKIKIINCSIPLKSASAGEARRRVLTHAMKLTSDGIILTTDADAIPDKNWIEYNFSEIEQGADVVCGMAEIDPAETQDWHRLKFDDMREKYLLKLIDEINVLADPEAADPWPRHQQNSGASIAVKAAVLRRVGGAPRVAIGEDRALIERLRLADARIRHAPAITVRVSGRLHGRAEGGMAETIKRRMNKPDDLLDEDIEPVVDAYRRVITRAKFRAIYNGAADAKQFTKDLLISEAVLNDALMPPFFGTAWDKIQRRSPVLQKRRVAHADLARETRQALVMRGQLRKECDELSELVTVSSSEHAAVAG